MRPTRSLYPHVPTGVQSRAGQRKSAGTHDLSSLSSSAWPVSGGHRSRQTHRRPRKRSSSRASNSSAMSYGFISATCLSHGRAAFGDPIFNFIGIPSPKREKLKTPRHHAAISHSVNVPPATTEPSADLNGIPSSGCGQREFFGIHRLHGSRQSSCYSGFGQHTRTLNIVRRASPALA